MFFFFDASYIFANIDDYFRLMKTHFIAAKKMSVLLGPNPPNAYCSNPLFITMASGTDPGICLKYG